MKFERDPTKGKANQEVVLDELRESRAYLDVHTNEEFYEDDVVKWNAPMNFKSYNKNEKKWVENRVKGFKGQKNFEVSHKVGDANVANDDDDDGVPLDGEVANKSDVAFIKGGITETKNVLYTPVMMAPGFYTVRYCLDDLDPLDASSKKKRTLSPKSYYYDRSIEELQEGTIELSVKVITSSTGIGFEHFQTYFQLMKDFLQISLDEAKRNRDVSSIKTLNQQFLTLEKNFKIEQVRLEPKMLKSNNSSAKTAFDLYTRKSVKLSVKFNDKVDVNDSVDNVSYLSACKEYDSEVMPLGSTALKSHFRQQSAAAKANVDALVEEIQQNLKKHVGESQKDLEDYLKQEKEAVNKIVQVDFASSRDNSLRLNFISILEHETNLKRLILCFKVKDLVDDIRKTLQCEVWKAWCEENVSWINYLADSSKSSYHQYSPRRIFLSDADEGLRSLRNLCKLASSILLSVLKKRPGPKLESTNYVYEINSNTMDCAVVRLCKLMIYKMSLILHLIIGGS